MQTMHLVYSMCSIKLAAISIVKKKKSTISRFHFRLSHWPCNFKDILSPHFSHLTKRVIMVTHFAFHIECSKDHMGPV